MNSSSRPSSDRGARRRALSPRWLAPLLGLAALAARVEAQTIKLATLVPEGSLWDKTIRRLGSAIKQATQGRVSFQIYPGGVAGDEPDLVRKMRIGQLQAAMLSSAGLGDIDPAFKIFVVPLLFQSDEEVQLVLRTLRPLFEQRLADKGFVLLHWGDAGWLRIFSSKPITSFEDFRSLKQFVWGSEGEMGRWYQELGLRPVALSATDVLTGLQTGLIEALPVTPLAALALQWFRSAPYMLDHRFAPLVGATIVTKSAWNKLAPADREQLVALARESEDSLFQEVPRQERDALAEMVKRGLTIARESGTDGDKWVNLGRQFQERFRTSAVPPEVFDQVSKLLDESRRAR